MNFYQRSKPFFHVYLGLSSRYNPATSRSIRTCCKSASKGSLLGSWKFGSVTNCSTNRLPMSNSCGSRSYHSYRQYEKRIKNWFEKHEETIVPLAKLVGIGCVITIVFGEWETVPYTKRKRLVILSRNAERKYEGEILPETQPHSIQVRRIAKDLIKALERGTDPSTVHDGSMKQSDGFKWEFIVVDEPVINAFCVPGGKIAVFKGLLDFLHKDEEVAAMIGHEVGHAVAGHGAESIARILWIIIMETILGEFIMPEVVVKMSNYLLLLPLSRKNEIEADYIGMMLMASAGYDPRVAPRVFEKFGKLSGTSPHEVYPSTHPTDKRRAEMLLRPQAMKEAMTIYTKVKAERRIEGKKKRHHLGNHRKPLFQHCHRYRRSSWTYWMLIRPAGISFL